MTEHEQSSAGLQRGREQLLEEIRDQLLLGQIVLYGLAIRLLTIGDGL